MENLTSSKGKKELSETPDGWIKGAIGILRFSETDSRGVRSQGMAVFSIVQFQMQVLQAPAS